ncbi:MAG: GNAT family N-acetyltransferase [Ancrocorticia sp.]|uniref:GNAT family N-acetyltransferase n=1 Tax=Ancrocorticia sp. TaxID=2593684 RepID=UPI003F8FD144
MREFLTPQPSWAKRCAVFDLRVFGREAWPLALWEHELASEFAAYRALVREGISAMPEILALGGVSYGPDAEILTLGVSEAERGKGMGAALLDELIGIAWASGAEQIFLEVRAGGAPAQHLYRSRGFETVGERPGYYHGEDALIMNVQREYTSSS